MRMYRGIHVPKSEITVLYLKYRTERQRTHTQDATQRSRWCIVETTASQTKLRFHRLQILQLPLGVVLDYRHTIELRQSLFARSVRRGKEAGHFDGLDSAALSPA